MNNKRGLTELERKALKSVHRMAFHNPFAEERRKEAFRTASDIFRELRKESYLPADATFFDLASDLEDGLHHYLEDLRKERLCDFTKFPEKDGRQGDKSDGSLLKRAILLDTYMHSRKRFDRLIDKIQAGKEQRPQRFGEELKTTYQRNTERGAFAEDILKLLTSRGFDVNEAEVHFSLFYQMRRAYHLISERVIGNSDPIKNLRKQIWENIFTTTYIDYESRLYGRMNDFTTFIRGETGTGKGVTADCIGHSAFVPYSHDTQWFVDNFDANYFSINLSQFTETIIESELFGHVKGAFTGANKDQAGILEKCSKNGCIFLDEIGEVNTSIQVKLLKVIQEREFYRVGSDKDINYKKHFEGRLLVGTHQDIDKLRQEKKFRDDFYYRICTNTIRVPTLYECLKECPEDLKALIDKELEEIYGDMDLDFNNKKSIEIYGKIKKTIPKDYRWPGNVRELEQAIRRIITTGEYEVDPQIHHQANQVIPEFITHMLNSTVDNPMSADKILAEYSNYLYYEKNIGNWAMVARMLKKDPRVVKKWSKEAPRG